MAACALMAVALGSCDNKKFRVEGAITEAKDSVLYFENMSLDGPVAVNSATTARSASARSRPRLPSSTACA